MGWLGKNNGELLALARSEFDALVTIDQSILHQQNLTERDVSAIVLVPFTNKIQDLEPLIPQVLEALQDLKRGQVIHIK